MILLHASFTILGLARYWDLGNEPSRALAPRVLLVDVLDGEMKGKEEPKRLEVGIGADQNGVNGRFGRKDALRVGDKLTA